MDKRLKPNTIIPSTLYVHRDADRQLMNIIEDMGRPGYVLVSRQMGKTNLLLNAKRELETPKDVFVYIDLSNPFDTINSCFESIIDLILETNSELSERVQSHIEKIRIQSSPDIPFHKKHMNELRAILRCVEGKLVIILDEIDALTKTPYSDQIFSQIRSIYFSRVNFTELSRLTYILSGVVEPTEIIKDPKISPFNIGEKIFLNDFSRSEFYIFIDKAQLSLSSVVKDRIFYWTGGNPRITWDVCSKIENIILENKVIDEEAVDNAVKEMYFVNYDIPPVNHIRDLVKNDREIKEAIIQIEYDMGERISDSVKDKLYLAGIINYENNKIRIKNNIIRQSLSKEWINTLENSNKSILRLANEKFEENNYVESLNLYKRYLENYEFEKEVYSINYYIMGLCAYNIGDYTSSILYLGKTKFSFQDQPKTYCEVNNVKGLSYYMIGEYELAKQCFEDVRSRGRKDQIYFRALLNLGSSISKMDDDALLEDSKHIFSSIVSDDKPDLLKLGDEFSNYIRTIAYYNLALITLKNLQNERQAIEYIKSAINFGKDSDKPILMLTLYELTDSSTEKHVILKSIVDILFKENLLPKEEHAEDLLRFNFNHLNELLLDLAFVKDFDLFEKIIIKYDNILSVNIFLKILEFIGTGFSKRNWIGLQELLKYIVDRTVDSGFQLDLKSTYLCYKFLAFLNAETSNQSYLRKYIQYFETEKYEEVDFVDLNNHAELVYNYIKIKNFNAALSHIHDFQKFRTEVSIENKNSYLVFDNFELSIYTQTKNIRAQIDKANEILRIINDPSLKFQNTGLLGETGLSSIKNTAESILRKNSLVINKNKKRYDRNSVVIVRYKDGRTVSTKYKKVESDIQAGECFILE